MNTLSNVLDNQSLQPSLFGEEKTNSNVTVGKYPIITDEFWTAKQRQACSLHEIAYRACFKAQLPNFFITKLTEKGETVYDPFSGRGTTIIEAALCGRNAIANDINPISRILSEGRTKIPTIQEIKKRLEEIIIDESLTSDIDLSMFFHKETLQEIISLKSYFLQKDSLDPIDKWLRMVTTNRLTGHSKGYFSVYTLPPNQAVSPERQIKINEKYQQEPTYRNTKEIIYKKSLTLLKDLTRTQKKNLEYSEVRFLNKDARNTSEISDEAVSLVITSPPFLDVVQYAQDNWLRCWFNGIDAKQIEKQITMSKTVEKWSEIMSDVFKELYRITKKDGWVAFEVGEVRNGRINLEDNVVPIGENAGFICNCVMINEQAFTKTANIWGVSNNNKGTNTNRIVVFKK
ncbi:MAG: site-specific DNA-methyltransferase [Acidobacteria bacterium]|nr:site-specific DNA-methyltransferase [Acidobacteriota bacterium]